jgi:hypothetical protein
MQFDAFSATDQRPRYDTDEHYQNQSQIIFTTLPVVKQKKAEGLRAPVVF